MRAFKIAQLAFGRKKGSQQNKQPVRVVYSCNKHLNNYLPGSVENKMVKT